MMNLSNIIQNTYTYTYVGKYRNSRRNLILFFKMKYPGGWGGGGNGPSENLRDEWMGGGGGWHSFVFGGLPTHGISPE
jgi:hypothetical protein